MYEVWSEARVSQALASSRSHEPSTSVSRMVWSADVEIIVPLCSCSDMRFSVCKWSLSSMHTFLRQRAANATSSTCIRIATCRHPPPPPPPAGSVEEAASEEEIASEGETASEGGVASEGETASEDEIASERGGS